MAAEVFRRRVAKSALHLEHRSTSALLEAEKFVSVRYDGIYKSGRDNRHVRV